MNVKCVLEHDIISLEVSLKDNIVVFSLVVQCIKFC